jgi:hypothetical protein
VLEITPERHNGITRFDKVCQFVKNHIAEEQQAEHREDLLLHRLRPVKRPLRPLVRVAWTA